MEDCHPALLLTASEICLLLYDFKLSFTCLNCEKMCESRSTGFNSYNFADNSRNRSTRLAGKCTSYYYVIHPHFIHKTLV